MTTYATGNPLGSTAAKDLYDNAQNLDQGVNGTALTFEDRLGVERISWAGMESQFQTLIVGLGYLYIGDYAAGLTITARNQIFRQDGEYWLPKASTELPYILTGTWATDSAYFLSAGDAVLRSQLTGTLGGQYVGGGLTEVASWSAMTSLSSSLPGKYVQIADTGATYLLDATDTTTAESFPFVRVAADGGRWKLRISPMYDIQIFGAKLDGTTDDTAAWNLAENYSVVWPAKKSRVTGQVRRGANTTLRGAGRTQSMFLVGLDFDMLASSVVKCTGGETAAEIYDVGFQFVQADQSSRAAVTQYPWALEATAMPRFIFDRIRIENAYNGISCTGNSGGGVLGFLEIGALNKGLLLEGSSDFVHGGHWHFWPFGIVNLSTLFNSVYADQTTIAAEIGNNDGVNIDSISTFNCAAVLTTGASTALPIQIGKFQCDGNGSRLQALGGKVNIGLMYSSKLNTSAYASVYASGTAKVVIGGLYLSTTSPVPDINTFDQAVIQVNGGILQLANPDAQPVRVDGGVIALHGLRFEPGATNYTQPHAVQASGALQVVNCSWSAANANTGVAIQFVSDDAANMMVGNTLNGWTSGPPASNLLGCYKDNFTAANSEIVSGNFIGVRKTRILLVTADASGNYTGAHGIASAQLRVIGAQAIRMGASGEASIATIASIDGTNVSVTGGTASARLRIVIEYMTSLDSW